MQSVDPRLSGEPSQSHKKLRSILHINCIMQTADPNASINFDWGPENICCYSSHASILVYCMPLATPVQLALLTLTENLDIN